MARSIALIGMPGGGKSTIGRQLAKRMHRGFADSDTVIEREIGCPIKEFFEREGESSFREIEARVILGLCATPDSVIATGGGVVLRPENRLALHSNTHVIYLRSTPEELYRRLKNDTQRPLLQVGDPLARIRDLFQMRDPLYRETAHFVVDTGRPSVATVVNMVLMQLELDGVISPDDVPSPVEAQNPKG